MTQSAESTAQAPDYALWERVQGLNVEEFAYQAMNLPAEALAAERRGFERGGGKYLPDLRPRNVDSGELEGQEVSLLTIKNELDGSLQDDGLRQLYKWRINELVGVLRMVRAAGQDNDRFAHYNHYIYGAPDRTIFEGVADWICTDAEALTGADNNEVRAAARTVMNTLGEHRGDRTSLIPSQEVFRMVRADQYRKGGFIALLLEGVELPEYVTQATGDPALRRMLANVGTGQTLEDAPYWSNTPTSVRRPPEYAMSRQEFVEYNAHEISHGMEYKNGRASNVALTATGLDRYERGNEGRAVVREQIANENLENFTSGARWYEIMCRHLGVSLGSGMIGGRRMNFAETESVVRAIYLMHQHRQGIDARSAAKNAVDYAWDLTKWVYKATDGSGRAGVYRRPMIYLEGSVSMWQWVTDTSQSIELGDRGKFDLSSARHTDFLRRLGILPHAV